MQQNTVFFIYRWIFICNTLPTHKPTHNSFEHRTETEDRDHYNLSYPEWPNIDWLVNSSRMEVEEQYTFETSRLERLLTTQVVPFENAGCPVIHRSAGE